MKNSMKRNVVVSSVMAIGLSASLLAGATFALFTSESKLNVAISSAKVDVAATMSNAKTWSAAWNDESNKYEYAETSADKQLTYSKDSSKSFANGGWVYYSADRNVIALHQLAPLDKFTFTIAVTNKSDINVQYRTFIKASSDSGLFEALKITIGGAEYNGYTAVSDWQTLATSDERKAESIDVSIELPEEAGNKYQGQSCEISYTVEAVQASAHVESDDDPDTTYLYTVTDLVNWGKSVNEGASYAGKTVKLMDNMSFYNSGKRYEWTPVDLTKSNNAGLVFDGNGKSITYLTIKGTYGGYGYAFFKNCKAAFTVKDVTFANINIEAADSNVVGVVMGYSYSTTTFENVKVQYCKIEGFGKVGAFIGMAADPGMKVNFKDCTSKNNTIEGGYNMGGIMGNYQRSAKGEENVTMDNVTLENNKFTVVANYKFGAVKDIDSKITCAAGANDRCIGNGNAVKGKYVGNKSGGVVYYYGCYADYYVSYGTSVHDCAFEGGVNEKIANGEICRNK